MHCWPGHKHALRWCLGWFRWKSCLSTWEWITGCHGQGKYVHSVPGFPDREHCSPSKPSGPRPVHCQGQGILATMLVILYLERSNHLLPGKWVMLPRTIGTARFIFFELKLPSEHMIVTKPWQGWVTFEPMKISIELTSETWILKQFWFAIIGPLIGSPNPLPVGQCD